MMYAKKFKSLTKALSVILIVSMCTLLVNTFSVDVLGSTSDVTVIVNGQEVSSGLILDSRSYVPLRSICEALGCEVNWDPEYRVIDIHNDDVFITMIVDSCIMARSKMYEDSEPEVFESDLPPRIIDSTTYIPLRTLSLMLDADISWDNFTKTVTIYYPGAGISSSGSTDSYSSNEAVTGMYSVYYDVLANMCGGTPKIYQDRTLSDSEYSYYRNMYDDVYIDNYDGIYYMSLTDMDNDGIEELIFCYAQGMLTVISDNIKPVGKFYVYTIENGQAVELYETSDLFLSSVNGSYTPGISYADGINYFIITYVGLEGSFAIDYSIYSKNGSSVALLLDLYSKSSGAGSEEYYIITNGCDKAISESLFSSEAQRYMNESEDKTFSGTTYESLPFFTPHYKMEKLTDSSIFDSLK